LSDQLPGIVMHWDNVLTELSIINVRMFSISKANLKRRCTPRDEQVKSVFELPPT
jgi:hypothetical protein